MATADQLADLARRTALEKERIREGMKKYADPRTETVSFSGADMTGVIFLPMSTDQLVDYIARKTFEYQKLRDLRADMTLAEIEVDGGAAYLSLSDRIDSALDEIKRLGKLQEQGGHYTRPVKLFDLQTVSISSHREKFPVRTLGRVLPKSYTRGPRTIAGSFIFTLFNKAALWDLLQATKNFYSSGVGINGTDTGYPELNTVLADQLPPFDLTIMCSNELGDNSYMVLYGLEVVNDGQTLSIQDIITENVMQFVARDFEPMRPLSEKRGLLREGELPITATSRVKKLRTERERRGIRLNPYI
jgi:hypothetical protein